MGDLWVADPVAVALPWLLSSAAVTEGLGAPDQVLAENEGPYPCIVLSDPPGNDRDLRHLIAPVLQIEVLGDPDGTDGKPALRRILYTALARLKELPDREYPAGEPVVTDVTSAGGGGWVPLPTGQPRYIATVTMHMHPPTAAAVP